MSAATVTPRRDWMSVGARYTTPERRAQVERTISRLEWREFTDGMSLPMCPGLGIEAAIKELRLPKVSAIAYNGALSFPAPDDESEYPGLYGIEANYKNGRARVYIVDNGCELLPIAADFWAKET